ncbi:MAG: helix-hairpin-helix domain-containing protein [Saprospiraceae bacterium]
MNKEYHYTISRTDRIYLIAFVSILLGWELIKEILPSGERSFSYISPPRVHNRYHDFKKNTYSKKSFSKKYSNDKYSINNPPNTFTSSLNNENNFEKKYSSFEEEQELTPPSSPIPIMTASIEELTSMGISKKVSWHIQKFISAGGFITSDRDLLKIYGMDSLQLVNASPYIIYGIKPAVEQPALDLKKESFLSTANSVDLNQASVEDLESLSGIGTVLANRIIKYRDAIGGFLNTDQLKECYGLPPETIEKIKNQVTVSGSPHLIFINNINLDSLSHPYLNKKLIRLIIAYKKQHGDFKSAEDFKRIYPPDSNWCSRILPYISFDVR